jgi:hypothetical protein
MKRGKQISSPQSRRLRLLSAICYILLSRSLFKKDKTKSRKILHLEGEHYLSFPKMPFAAISAEYLVTCFTSDTRAAFRCVLAIMAVLVFLSRMLLKTCALAGCCLARIFFLFARSRGPGDNFTPRMGLCCRALKNFSTSRSGSRIFFVLFGILHDIAMLSQIQRRT